MSENTNNEEVINETVNAEAENAAPNTNIQIPITFTIPGEAYRNAVEAVYHRTGGHFNMPGFRNGRAPRKVIEKAYGENVFWDETLWNIVDAAYAEAVKERDLIPMQDNHCAFVHISETEAPCVLEALAEVKEPTVTLGQYKGIEVPMQEYNVTDEMVDKELDERRHQQARLVSVDRPIELGDTVTFDFAGFLGDEQFEGGTAEGHTMVIGSHQFIPGFEEQMVGMSVDEERDINVSFPEDYHAEHLAGKPVVFKVKVHEISYEELPELNDDFAADTSDFDTLDELKADIRRELEERTRRDRDSAFESAVLQTVIDNAAIDINEELIHAEAHADLHDLEHQLAQFGATIEDFAASMGTTAEEVHENYHQRAENRLKANLVLRAVIDAEHIEPTEADFEAVVRQYADRAGSREEIDFETEMLPENRSKYADAALYEAVIRVLKESAVIVKKEAE